MFAPIVLMVALTLGIVFGIRLLRQDDDRVIAPLTCWQRRAVVSGLLLIGVALLNLAVALSIYVATT